MFSLSPVPSEASTTAQRLAQRHAPIIYFDAREPFLPLAVGYSIFTSDQASASFKRTISLPAGITTVIEYAIWWDWDIQHLYELEHLWLYLDADEQLVKAEGSFHGDLHALTAEDGSIHSEAKRLIAYSEPGKHAFAGHPGQLEKLKPFTEQSCTTLAGKADVLINDMFKAEITPSPLRRRLCTRFMQAHAFTPSYDFSQRLELSELPLMHWDRLRSWIPGRVNGWLEQLETRLPHLKAVLLDCGDTIIDEGSEVKDDEGIVLSASLIPGADKMMAGLVKAGYTLALVADGQVKSFENILGQAGLYKHFDSRAISETVGQSKPAKVMFTTALDALGIGPAAYHLTVMVGNNLERDIKGANWLGLNSIWLDWAPRRSKIPADEHEVPDYSIKQPQDLLAVLAQLELDLARRFLAEDA